MLGFVGELDDLVFDGWAIARADALNAAGVHGRAMDVFANQPECLRRCEGDIATDLRLHNLLGAKAERRGIGVAGLLFEHFPADGASIEPRRRTGLEAAGAKPQVAECFA